MLKFSLFSQNFISISFGKQWKYAKNTKISRKIQKFYEKCRKKTFIKVKEGKSFIWHNESSNIELLEQFHNFYWAINCCTYKTHGFHKIFAFCEYFFVFSRNFHISRNFRISYFREKRLWNATENFRVFTNFSWNVLFAGLKGLDLPFYAI